MPCYAWYREYIVVHLPAILEAANVMYDYNCGLLCQLVHVLNLLVFCKTPSSFMSLQTPVIFPNNSTVMYDQYALMTK